jgi:hypothetical protein
MQVRVEMSKKPRRIMPYGGESLANNKPRNTKLEYRNRLINKDIRSSPNRRSNIIEILSAVRKTPTRQMSPDEFCN